MFGLLQDLVGKLPAHQVLAKAVGEVIAIVGDMIIVRLATVRMRWGVGFGFEAMGFLIPGCCLSQDVGKWFSADFLDFFYCIPSMKPISNIVY